MECVPGFSAGGTSEKIDDVRTITNSSTGRLGYAVGTAFLQQYADELEAVYYLHGTRARHPEHEKVIPIEIGGVADLQRELGRILAEEKNRKMVGQIFQAIRSALISKI